MSSAPRPRVVALAAGLAALALAAGFFLLTRGQDSSSAASASLGHDVMSLRKAAKLRAARQTGAKRARTAPKAAKAAKPAKPAKAAKPAKPAQNGLPAPVAEALRRHRVVVVSLFAPSVELDDMARREAAAGAAGAGAGFVSVNVLSDAQARPLTQLLGVLEDPGVLVFRSPGELVVRFSGFADQQTVAQAARNAAL